MKRVQVFCEIVSRGQLEELLMREIKDIEDTGNKKLDRRNMEYKIEKSGATGKRQNEWERHTERTIDGK